MIKRKSQQKRNAFLEQPPIETYGWGSDEEDIMRQNLIKDTKDSTVEDKVSEYAEYLAGLRKISNSKLSSSTISHAHDENLASKKSIEISSNVVEEFIKNREYSPGATHALETDTPTLGEIDNSEDEESEPDDLPNKIVEAAILNLTKKGHEKLLEGYQASYLLMALGNALLRSKDIRDKSKEVKDPLAFKIKSLGTQLFEKSTALEVLKKWKKKDLVQEYSTSIERIEKELEDVKTLYETKEELHKDLAGMFSYIPKRLSNTFIEAYNKRFNTDYKEKDITEELREFRDELTKLMELQTKLACKTGSLFTVVGKLSDKHELLDKIIALGKIKEKNNGKNELVKMLEGNQNINAHQKTIKLAQELFKVKNLEKLEKKINQDSSTADKFTKKFGDSDIEAINNELESFLKTCEENVPALAMLLNQFKGKISKDDGTIKKENIKLDMLLKQVNNLVGKAFPEGKHLRIQALIQALHSHMEKAYKYAIDPEYLKSLEHKDFLVQVRVLKKLGRDMMKNVLILQTGGYETLKITIPPGINTTLEINPSGAGSYFLGELGSYKNIGIWNLSTLKNYTPAFINSEESGSRKEKEQEFKYLHQIEAIRNCSALLTNLMFFELAAGKFQPYHNDDWKDTYSLDKIAELMPMAMPGAVSATVYLEQEFDKLIPYQLTYDYRLDTAQGADTLAVRDNNILFDWLCYKLKKADCFYQEIPDDKDITSYGWKKNAKDSTYTNGNYQIKIESVEVTYTTEKKVTSHEEIVISEILRFPLEVFEDLINQWYKTNLELEDFINALQDKKAVFSLKARADHLILNRKFDDDEDAAATAVSIVDNNNQIENEQGFYSGTFPLNSWHCREEYIESTQAMGDILVSC